MTQEQEAKARGWFRQGKLERAKGAYLIGWDGFAPPSVYIYSWTIWSRDTYPLFMLADYLVVISNYTTRYVYICPRP